MPTRGRRTGSDIGAKSNRSRSGENLNRTTASVANADPAAMSAAAAVVSAESAVLLDAAND
jgi:hypothetical protein